MRYVELKRLDARSSELNLEICTSFASSKTDIFEGTKNKY